MLPFKKIDELPEIHVPAPTSPVVTPTPVTPTPVTPTPAPEQKQSNTLKLVGYALALAGLVILLTILL